jgi:hypothetical protein
LVNESGNLNSTETLPLLSVTSDGVKLAIAVKLLRTSMGVEASGSGSGTDADKLLDISFALLLGLASFCFSAIGLAMDDILAMGAADCEGAGAILFCNISTPPPGAPPRPTAIDELLELGMASSGSGGFGAFSANFCKSSELQLRVNK